MENKIKISSFDDGLVIKISGELDSYKTMIYKDKICLSIATKKPHLLLFDLKELTFLDSAGIGLILGRYNEIKKINGLVGLIGLNTYSRRIVNLTGLTTIIKEYKSVASFKKEAHECLARTAVISFVSQLNPSMETISEIKTIVSEAVSNAIIHGYHLDASKDVYIKCSIDDKNLNMIISDFGKGIADLKLALTPHFTSRPDLERAGMGLTIIQSLSDSFEIKSVLNMGTKLIIKKKVVSKDIEACLDEQGLY